MSCTIPVAINAIQVAVMVVFMFICNDSVHAQMCARIAPPSSIPRPAMTSKTAVNAPEGVAALGGTSGQMGCFGEQLACFLRKALHHATRSVEEVRWK